MNHNKDFFLPARIVVRPLMVLLLCLPIFARAQLAGPASQDTISYATFLSRVSKQNLAYQAEILSLDIALAEQESAKIFPDPVFSFEAADHGQRRMQMGYEFQSSLEWTMELGGKRRARMALARNQSDLARTILADYLQNLRADASIKFLSALFQQNLYKVKVSSFTSMQELAYADSLRFALGEITEIDARQSQLEARLLKNELLEQEAAMKQSGIELNRLMGEKGDKALASPLPGVYSFNRKYELEELLSLAVENRQELKAALQQEGLARAARTLVKAEQRMDIDLSIGLGNATAVTNLVAPTPSTTSVLAGVAIPLKFSSRNKGALTAAELSVQQSELESKDMQLAVESEIAQAFLVYETAAQQFQHIDLEVLSSAKRILQGKTYSYQRGETSLLEVLEAQRTFNEVQELYYQSLFDFGSALIELQRAVGIWDVSL